MGMIPPKKIRKLLLEVPIEQWTKEDEELMNTALEHKHKKEANYLNPITTGILFSNLF